MRIKNFLILITLVMVLMCCVSAISAASNDTVTDELSEIDSGDESLSVSNDKQAGGVDKNSALTADENNEEPTITSGKYNTHVYVKGTNVTEGENATIQIKTTQGSGLLVSLPVTININGENITRTTNNQGWTDIIITSSSLTIGENKVTVYYNGDDTHNANNATGIINVKEKELANVSFVANPVWIGNNATVSINVPNATGNITIEINGKTYTVNLTNNTANITISNADLIDGENTITATYNGPEFISNTNSTVLYVLNGIVNQDNYIYYFDQTNGGKLVETIPEGATLDFQGSIINNNQSVNIYFDVSKPVNIISSTHDAYIDLNTTAGSLLGENPGNRFTISRGGSYTNMTGIRFHNTQLWVFNTTHVILDNISNIIEDQRVGSGVGATSIRANSTYVTVKNSYFYTRNNGGSSSLVIAWADYCTFDNNTVEVEGDVGNMIYLTTFNVDVPEGVLANVHNNITNNRIFGPNKSAAICWALVLSGAYNLVENNTINYVGTGITTQWGNTESPNNIIRNNNLYNGSSMSLLPDSIAYNNYVSGTFSTGARSVVYNNTVLKTMTIGTGATAYNNTAASMTINDAATVYGNTINGLTVNKANNIIYDNTINGVVSIAKNGKNTTFTNNVINGTITVNSNDNNIKDNTITTTGDYAIDLKTSTGNNVTGNTLIANAKYGNVAVKVSNENNITNNVPTADINIITNPVWTGNDATVSINVPNATGNITIEINGKTYTVNLTNNTANITISNADLIDGENTITTTYKGPEFAQNTKNAELYVLNGIVNQDNYLYYFDQTNGGKLVDAVPEGATLDFQGSIINPNQKNTVQMNINKPVNIISTTGDAYIDLNTTAGSLLGESPGNSFAVTHGGSNSNITGINFHNTQLWISNTTNVVFDNISNIVEDQRVGSGVGATSIRDNSSYVTIKNSYFYTRNNGGSTTFTFAWANYCTFDNNTVKAEGNVGNLIYLNIYNIAGIETPKAPVNNHNTVSNNKIYGKEGSSISVGLMVEGSYNLIVNNTLYKSSISTSFGGVNPYNNTYIGNTMTEGSSMTTQPGSIVYNNNVTGALTLGKENTAYNNTVGKAMTVKDNSLAYENTVGELKVTAKNSIVKNNQINGAVNIAKAATNTTFANNTAKGTVTVLSNNNVITGNMIETTGDYAIDLKTTENNTIKNNILIANNKTGNDAVNGNMSKNNAEGNADKKVIITLITPETVAAGKAFTIKVSVTDDFGNPLNGTIIIELNDGNGILCKVRNGQGTINCAPSAAGATMTFTNTELTQIEGFDKIEFISNPVNVDKYNTNIVAEGTTVTIGENATISILTTKEGLKTSLPVVISINGMNMTVTTNGLTKVVINAANLIVGENNVTIYYNGNNTQKASKTTTTILVNKVKTTLTAKDLVMTYNTNPSWIVTLKDANGNALKNTAVSVLINGKTKILTTNDQGQIKIATSGLAPKSYSVKISFTENGTHYAVAKSVKLTIKKATVKVTAKAKTFKVKVKTKKYTITLKNNVNKVMKNTKVTLKVNGKTYTAKTNSKGQATFKITKLTKKGKYNAVIKYAGSSYYNKLSKTVKITAK